MIFLIFTIPDAEPHNSHDQAKTTEGIGHGFRQAQHLLGQEEERGTYSGHEECRNKRNPEALIIANQINCYRPESEHRECLVGPSEVTPDDIEAVGRRGW